MEIEMSYIVAFEVHQTDLKETDSYSNKALL
jgi:hypothetical protein